MRRLDVLHGGGHTPAADIATCYALTRHWVYAERFYKSFTSPPVPINLTDLQLDRTKGGLVMDRGLVTNIAVQTCSWTGQRVGWLWSGYRHRHLQGWRHCSPCRVWARSWHDRLRLSPGSITFRLSAANLQAVCSLQPYEGVQAGIAEVMV